MSSLSNSTIQLRLEEDHLEVVGNSVFGNDLLRERILELAIREDNKLSINTVRTCRLVHSSWLLSITKCLRKSREPLFSLNLKGRQNNDSEADFSLERFSVRVAHSLRRQEHFPPTQLIDDESYYRKSTLQNVADWLHNLQCSLVDISLIALPDPEDADPVSMSSVNFPILRKLGIWLEDSYDPKEQRSLNITNFVQLILSGCQELKQFQMLGFVDVEGSFPVDFENLRLPPTLTNLELLRGFTGEQLMRLTASPLPKLTQLTLPITTNPYEDNVVFRVLNRFCDTLKHLILTGPADGYFGSIETDEFNPTFIKLPRMVSLATLEIQSISIRWPKDNPACEAINQAPALETMKYRQQNLAKFREWTTGPQLKSVANVHIDLTFIDEDGPNRSGFGVLRDFTILAFRAFPNIVKLNLDFKMLALHGLSSMFKRFTKLPDLGLHIKSNDFCLNKCVSVFLGIPEEWAAALLATEKSWNQVHFTKGEKSSIKNMSGLRSLHLSSLIYCKNEQISVAFDAVFHFGLMMMPNLQEVCLGDGTQVSTKTAKKWRDSGRILKTSKT